MSTGAGPSVRPGNLPPKIYKAILGTGGDVVRGTEITEATAVDERKAGRDVVVCGQNLRDNYALAQKIETTANGNCKACPPHYRMGPGAMYHFHADPRPPHPHGHCFYETTKRKAKKAKTKP